MRFGLDHAVIVVPALAPAMDEYRAAGFTVTPGGRHDVIPTENALIPFADGTYLELLAPRHMDTLAELRARRARDDWDAELRGGSAVGRRIYPRLVEPAGVADYVIVVRGLAAFAAEARRRGYPMTGPTPMGRARADGVELAWTLALPESPALPYFIEDRTPREQRVPGGEPARHPNGASGIAEVRVRAADLPGAALAYAGLFDGAPRALADGRTRLDFAGVPVVLEAGEPEGACGVTLRGLRSTHPAIRAHGVAAEPA